jgi:2-iminobutanoate/2-iminopropanoate deaminase
MAKRISIHIEGFSHKNPIPSASKIGNLLVSGAIAGLDPATGKPAATLEAQCALVFRHIRSIMQAAGGSPDDIIKVAVVMADRGQRDALNKEWLAMFPDAHSRPARHTSQSALEGGILIQCEIMAVLGAV